MFFLYQQGAPTLVDQPILHVLFPPVTLPVASCCIDKGQSNWLPILVNALSSCDHHVLRRSPKAPETEGNGGLFLHDLANAATSDKPI